MSTAINSNGAISINSMNEYLGANNTAFRPLSGVYSSPNFSLNQIFFSEENTDPPTPASNNFTLSSLRGKTFGIYKFPFRTTLHGETYGNTLLDPNELQPVSPMFTGYFGFGTSGILNPLNRGFPIEIYINSLMWGDLQVSVKKDDTYIWQTINLTSRTTTFIRSDIDAIRITSNARGESLVTLRASPALNNTGGIGSHTIMITLSEDGRIRDPIDGPDDGLDDGLDNPPPIIEP